MRLARVGLHILFLTALLLALRAGFAGDVCLVGGLSREATLAPGGKSEGRIILQNNADQPREVKVYQTDYLFYADGKNVYGEPGSIPRSNCSWITFTPRQFVIGPKETYSVYYTVQVPSDPALLGTYWSILMVEPLPEGGEAPPIAKDGEAQVGIRTVLRYGIQFVTNIGDTGTRALKFTDKQLITNGNERTLQLDIENTGERWLRPSIWAELYDANGVSIGRFDGGRLRLYPGCSGRFKIDLSQVPPGSYQALTVADNGDDYVFGAQFKLEIK
jgi:hypothetical protein